MRSSGITQATWVRWRIVGLLLSLSFMSYVNRVSMSVTGTRMRVEWGLDEVQLGWIYSILIIGYAVFMFPGGWFSDRIGGRMALVGFGFGTALFCALTGVQGYFLVVPMHLFVSLMVIRGVFGVLTAPLYPAAGRVVANWIPFRRRALANALVTGAAMLGISFTHPCFGWLLDTFGWQMAFVITGSVTAGLGALWSWYGKDYPDEHQGVNEAEHELIRHGLHLPGDPEDIRCKQKEIQGDVESAPWASVLHNRSLWLITLCYATLGYLEYLVFYWSEYYFRDVARLNEDYVRFAAMLPPLAMAFGIPFGGWLADRTVATVGYRAGRAGTAAVGMLFGGAALCAGTFTNSPVGIIFCFTACLAMIGIAEASAWTTAIDLGGPRSATSAGIANTGGNLGGALTLVVTPWIGTTFASDLDNGLSWAWAIRLGGLVCMLGALLWIWIDASERVHTDQ